MENIEPLPYGSIQTQRNIKNVLLKNLMPLSTAILAGGLTALALNESFGLGAQPFDDIAKSPYWYNLDSNYRALYSKEIALSLVPTIIGLTFGALTYVGIGKWKK